MDPRYRGTGLALREGFGTRESRSWVSKGMVRPGGVGRWREAARDYKVWSGESREGILING